MKKLFFAVMTLLLLCEASSAKDYARRFPTDTSMEVYTPNNPPPIGAYLALDQTTPQLTTGKFSFPTIGVGVPNVFGTTLWSEYGVLKMQGDYAFHQEALSIDFGQYGINITNDGSYHPNTAGIVFKDFPFYNFTSSAGKGGFGVNYNTMDKDSYAEFAIYNGYDVGADTWDSVYSIGAVGSLFATPIYEPNEFYIYDYVTDYQPLTITQSQKAYLQTDTIIDKTGTMTSDGVSALQVNGATILTDTVDGQTALTVNYLNSGYSGIGFLVNDASGTQANFGLTVTGSDWEMQTSLTGGGQGYFSNYSPSLAAYGAMRFIGDPIEFHSWYTNTPRLGVYDDPYNITPIGDTSGLSKFFGRMMVDRSGAFTDDGTSALQVLGETAITGVSLVNGTYALTVNNGSSDSTAKFIGPNSTQVLIGDSASRTAINATGNMAISGWIGTTTTPLISPTNGMAYSGSPSLPGYLGDESIDFVNRTLRFYGGSINETALDWSGGGLKYRYVEVTSTYHVLVKDYTVNCTANSFTVTLPTAVGVTGQIYNIKNSGTGVITVATTSSELIDGNLTEILNQHDNMQVQSTGGGWIII